MYFFLIACIGLAICISCGGEGSKSAGQKIKSNPYLGDLPGAVETYNAEKQRFMHEAEEEIKKKHGDMTKMKLSDLEALEKKYEPLVSDNETMLKDAIEKAQTELIDKVIPFESRNPLLETVSMKITGIAKNGTVSTWAIVKATQPFALGSNVTTVYCQYLDAEGTEIYRDKWTFASKGKNTRREAEPGEEFATYLHLVLEKIPSMADLAKIVVITKDEFDTR
jgi:hypothetical protein